MYFAIIAPFLALAASVSAITITYPTSQNATLDFSKSQDLTWTSVTSDPKTIRLELVNQQVFPNFNVVVKDSINTSDGKFTIQPLSGPALNAGYQFNFYSTEQSSGGLVAQSQQFTIEKVADKAVSTTASSAASATSASASTSPSSSGKNSATGLKVGAWGVVVAGGLAAFL